MKQLKCKIKKILFLQAIIIIITSFHGAAGKFFGQEKAQMSTEIGLIDSHKILELFFTIEIKLGSVGKAHSNSKSH